MFGIAKNLLSLELWRKLKKERKRRMAYHCDSPLSSRCDCVSMLTDVIAKAHGEGVVSNDARLHACCYIAFAGLDC